MFAFMGLIPVSASLGIYAGVQELRAGHVLAALQLQGATLTFIVVFFIVSGCLVRVLRVRRREPPPPFELPPMVSFILPVKGVREHSETNWRVLLTETRKWRGPAEFLFVVEAEDDEALPVLRRLVDELMCKNARLLVAGLATQTSQKLHNQLHGVDAAHADAEFVLFLDDDIAPHPELLPEMVAELRRDERTLLATGYPFDAPEPAGSLASYAIMAFRTAVGVPYQLMRQGQFVWGGCMLLRTADLRADRCRLMSRWRKGGYSDDMIAAAVCADHALPAANGDTAFFPNPLPADARWPDYWGYIRRQWFTLMMWQSGAQLAAQSLLLALYMYISTAITLPAPLGLVVALAGAAAAPSADGDASASPPPSYGLLYVTAWLVFALAVFVSNIVNDALSRELRGGGQHAGPNERAVSTAAVPPRPWGVGVYLRTLCGLYLHHVICVPAAVSAGLSDSIMWGGIEYGKRRGVLRSVRHARRGQAEAHLVAQIGRRNIDGPDDL